MNTVKEKRKNHAFPLFIKSIIEQLRLEGTLKDHLVKLFLGKGA